MRYKTCPGCGGSNKATAKTCYNCDGSFADQPKTKSAEPLISSEEQKVALQQTGHTTLTAFLAVALSTIGGGAMGFGLSVIDLDMPFFLSEILMGVVCAVVTAYCIGKFQDMPEGLLGARLLPAALYGASVGLCLFMVWWSFDPTAGFPVIGMIAGFCTGIPICVSFGLAGGESRRIGTTELANFGISLGLGVIIALFLFLEEGDFYLMPGVVGALGLLPTLMGGRLNLADIMQHLPQSRYSNNWD